MESQKLRTNITSVSPAMGADTKMKSNIEGEKLFGIKRPAAGLPATNEKQAPPK
jgi:hypothetical protein